MMETATKVIQQTAPKELQKELESDLWDLRTQVKGAPERLRGKFIRMPLTEPIGILPDGRVAFRNYKEERGMAEGGRKENND